MLTRSLVPVVAALSICQSPANAEEASVFLPDWQERLFHVDAMMEYSIEVDEAIGVETLIIQDGQVLMHKAYGVEDVDTQKSLAPGAIWSVKSMTKPVVALAILMLVDEGKLELHEPISTWLPDFKGDHRATVSDLLSHKSGVSGLGGERYRVRNL
jgi:CubicO group peptidase (beta-lactamase class C family)